MASAFCRLRFARIAPLLLLLLLLLVLSLLHFAGVKNYVVHEDTGGRGRALLAALTFNINWLFRWDLSPARCSRFVVFALIGLFWSPAVLLFAATILLAALPGEAVARLYSEPMSHRLRGQKPTLTPDPNGLY